MKKRIWACPTHGVIAGRQVEERGSSAYCRCGLKAAEVARPDAAPIVGAEEE